jgi:hypothetical protein
MRTRRFVAACQRCGRDAFDRLETPMRSAVPVFAAALLSLASAASAGNITTGPGAGDPAGPSGLANPPATTLASVPVLTTDLPAAAPQQDRPAAAVGASPNGPGAAASEGVSIGTVQMLLSPPPPPPSDGD